MKAFRLAAILLGFLLVCSASFARGGFGGGRSFGGGGFGRSSGGFSFGRSSGGFSFGRRSGGSFGGGLFGSRRASPSFSLPRRTPSPPSVILAPPPRTPGAAPRTGFGSTNIGAGPSARPGARYGTGVSDATPTNIGRGPSARPSGGATTRPYGVGSFGSTRNPTGYGSNYEYRRGLGGVYVPVGYSPWPFYGWYFLPWLFPHPYPPGFGYAYHASPLGSLFAMLLGLAIATLAIWLIYRVVKGAMRPKAGFGVSHRYQ